MKFGRRFRITIETGDRTEAVVIEDPLTVEFSVNRSVASSINNMNLSIYNLKQETRNLIFQDKFNQRFFGGGTVQYRQIRFEAGYDELSTIFAGNLYEAQSERVGPDVITRIVARDGAFDATTTNTFTTFGAGAVLSDVIGSLITDFPNLTQGEFGLDDFQFARGVTVAGNTYKEIVKYTGGRVFIDAERVIALKENQAINGFVPLLNSDTGLIQTPKRQDAFINVELVFDPRLILGQIVAIESDIEEAYNGQYKIVSIRHDGNISGAVGGAATTRLGLYIGQSQFDNFEVIN